MGAGDLIALASPRIEHPIVKPKRPKSRACGSFKFANGRLQRMKESPASQQFVLENGISRDVVLKMLGE